jgi:hypothetical protein
MDIKLTGLTTATVDYGSSAGDFLPFTTLPQSYHGRRVVLVPLTVEMEAEIANVKASSGDYSAVDKFAVSASFCNALKVR